MKWKLSGASLTGLATASLLCTGTAQAQAASDPALPPGTIGLTFHDSAPPAAIEPIKAADDAPNIILILLDDVGFGQYAAFGGGATSPTMDRLARIGLRFNRFHTSGICSPTRAALLTGRNPHDAGFGNIGELATGHEGYTGILPDSTATIPTILNRGGYVTAMIGKNHNTPIDETGPSGPFKRWPTGYGFDYFYGFNGWGTDQWHPTLYENTTPVPPSDDPEYNLNVDLADRAIAWLQRMQSVASDRPYFLYLSTGATHSPHHVPEQWIAQFEGKFDAGWDLYREQVFARQKQLGVIPPDTELTPRPAAIPAWNSLTAEQQEINARQMEVFAAFSTQTDYEIGRVISAAQSLPDADNTLILLIVGDNGADAAGGPGGLIAEMAGGNGFGKEAEIAMKHLPDLGGPKYDNHFSNGWAWAVNTPFRYYKQVVSHLGGIRNPMILSWPDRVKDPGAIRDQFLYVTDVASTFLAAAGLPMPNNVAGIPQKPLDGVNALPVITSAKAPEVRHRQYFEILGNRGIYDRGWFASAKLADPWLFARAELDPLNVKWELYNLDKDFSQATDVAAQYPDRLNQMKSLWWTEAARNNVLPLDWRMGERFVDNVSKQTKTRFLYYPGTYGIPESNAPVVRNRSWTILAKGNFQPADNGMLVTQGGTPGGWAFYLKGGIPTFDYNLSTVERFRVAADNPIPPGTKMLSMAFAYDASNGNKRGGGGTVTLLADGKAIGTGRVSRTIANVFALTEGMDIGADYGSPVSDYPFPYPFSGDLHSVAIELAPH